MTKLTITRIENSHGEAVAAVQDGNNVAFMCQACGHPVLMSEYMHESGNVKCICCGQAYVVEWFKETDNPSIVISLADS